MERLLRARDATHHLQLPTGERGRAAASLLGEFPSVWVATMSEDLSPAFPAATVTLGEKRPRWLRGMLPKAKPAPAADPAWTTMDYGRRPSAPVEQRVIDSQSHRLFLVRGMVTPGGAAWVLTTDSGHALPLSDWPESDAFRDGRLWGLVKVVAPTVHPVWAVEVRWPDSPQFRVPRYSATPADSLFAMMRRQELLDLLDLNDLGISDPLEQRWTYVALMALISGEDMAEGVIVGDESLADWCRYVLAMSATREPWSRAAAVLRQAEAHEAGLAGGAPDGSAGTRARVAMPAPRLVKSHRAAEEYTVEVMRAIGFPDARITAPGADGGVDVRSSGAVAQVKMEALATGRPAVQNIFGIAAHEGRRALFFSLAGYSDQALTWAHDAGVACFEFEFDGSIKARTSAARDILVGVAAERDSGEGVARAQAAFDELGPVPVVTRFPRFDPRTAAFRGMVGMAERRFGPPPNELVEPDPGAWAPFVTP